jgi:hypothetical protein
LHPFSPGDSYIHTPTLSPLMPTSAMALCGGLRALEEPTTKQSRYVPVLALDHCHLISRHGMGGALDAHNPPQAAGAYACRTQFVFACASCVAIASTPEWITWADYRLDL